MEAEPRSVQIRTDSQYVIHGVSVLESQRENGDLWRVMGELLDARGRDACAFIKVKGHAKDVDVSSGIVLAIDKAGNDAADGLAVKAHAGSALA